MSSAQFTEWLAYASIEPFGYEIENYRAGVIAATVANVAPRKKGARPLKVSDFYPSKSTKAPLLTAKQLRERHKRRKKNG